MKRILNLGAGIGSTTVYLLAADGLIDPFDVAIFADTQGEPKAVYNHLRWMQGLADSGKGPPIIVASRGSLAADLLAGVNAAGAGRKGGGRFASIPAFTGDPISLQSEGRTGRQCTGDYKVDVVEKVIRQQLFGLKARQRMPAGKQVVQLFGLHDDEAGRIKRVGNRFRAHPWAEAEFPLAKLGWPRAKCVEYLSRRVPHQVPRSACLFCPYRSDREWKHLRDTEPESFQEAVRIDHAIRDPSAACTAGLRKSLYLHRSLTPLAMVDIDSGAAREEERARRGKRQLDLFELEDCGVGMCGI